MIDYATRVIITCNQTQTLPRSLSAFQGPYFPQYQRSAGSGPRRAPPSDPRPAVYDQLHVHLVIWNYYYTFVEYYKGVKSSINPVYEFSKNLYEKRPFCVRFLVSPLHFCTALIRRQAVATLQQKQADLETCKPKARPILTGHDMGQLRHLPGYKMVYLRTCVETMCRTERQHAFF